MPMLKKLAPIVVVNVAIVCLFVLSSYTLVAEFNSYPDGLFYVNWNPLGSVTINHAGAFVNGHYMPVGAVTSSIDFPFWLFFVSTAVNMVFIVKLIKDQKTVSAES